MSFYPITSTFRFFANRGKKRKNIVVVDFFPSLSISHIEEPHRCWSVTQPSILSFLSPLHFFLLAGEQKKKRNESGSNETRWIKRKMPESLYYQCSVSSRNRFFLDARVYQRFTSWLIHPRVNPVIELSIEEQCENESTWINQSRDWN